MIDNSGLRRKSFKGSDEIQTVGAEFFPIRNRLQQGQDPKVSTASDPKN